MSDAPTAELEAVNASIRALTDRVGELLAARSAAYRTLDDWTGGLRTHFDQQFPSSQADLDDLVDEAGIAGEAARQVVARVIVDDIVLGD